MSEYAQLDASGINATQLPRGNIRWDDRHYCPASALTLEEAAFFRVVPLTVVQPPQVDRITQTVVRDGCVNDNGVWKYNWSVVNLHPDQVLQNIRDFSQGLTNQLTTEYEERMRAIASSYPPSERESWPVQSQEAQAFLNDPTTPTPWIDAASEARGIDKTELAQRILGKDAMYRIISGKLSGARQKIEDRIAAAGDDIDLLKSIDVKADWPELAI